MKKPFITVLFFLLGFLKLSALENHLAGARSLALSHSFVSISDAWSTYHNQAGLAQLEQFYAGIFYESKYLISELSLTAGSIILPVNAGVFGCSFFQFGQGTYKESKLGLAFAKSLSEKIQAGIQLDYFSQRWPENSGLMGFATFEAGIIYSPNKKLFLGAHVFNPIFNGIETSEGKQKMSAVFRVGGHYQFDEMILLTAEIQKNTEYPFRIKTGIEFFPVQNLALRFGLSGKPLNYTAGLGYSFGKVTTDIGFSYHGNLGLAPSVSIQFIL
jgi:hypothetical protein